MRRLYISIWPALLLLVILTCANCQNSRQAAGVTDSLKVTLVLEVEALDRLLPENSGIIFFRNRLWTFNDSGGDPVIYAFSPASGKVLQTIEIRNAMNLDWEEIAQDRDFIYVGDIGDNYGRRKKLVIYKVAKKSVPLSRYTSLKAGKITFSYSDKQDDMDIRQGRSHDCEAFFVYNDTIYLFTKNRHDQTSSLYKIPVVPGNYEVSASAVFQSGGLITGADISDDSQFVVLTGYRDYIPFVWVLYDYTLPDFFSGRMQRFDFEDVPHIQNEGIAIKNASRIFISTERSTFPPRLYTIDLSSILESGKH